MKPIIIEGYKGIMPLDLSGVDPKYYKIVIDQHNEDIKAYNRYQDTLPTKLKYENTTGKAMQLLQKDQEWLLSNSNKKRLEQIENDKEYHKKHTQYLQYLSKIK